MLQDLGDQDDAMSASWKLNHIRACWMPNLQLESRHLPAELQRGSFGPSDALASHELWWSLLAHASHSLPTECTGIDDIWCPVVPQIQLQHCKHLGYAQTLLVHKGPTHAVQQTPRVLRNKDFLCTPVSLPLFLYGQFAHDAWLPTQNQWLSICRRNQKWHWVFFLLWYYNAQCLCAKVRSNHSGAAAYSSLCQPCVWDKCWRPDLEKQRWGFHKGLGNDPQAAPHWEDLSSPGSTCSFHTTVAPKESHAKTFCCADISLKSWSGPCECSALPKQLVLCAPPPEHGSPGSQKLMEILELVWMKNSLTLCSKFPSLAGASLHSGLFLQPRHAHAPWSFPWSLGKARRAAVFWFLRFDFVHTSHSHRGSRQDTHWWCRQPAWHEGLTESWGLDLQQWDRESRCLSPTVFDNVW